MVFGWNLYPQYSRFLYNRGGSKNSYYLLVICITIRGTLVFANLWFCCCWMTHKLFMWLSTWTKNTIHKLDILFSNKQKLSCMAHMLIAINVCDVVYKWSPDNSTSKTHYVLHGCENNQLPWFDIFICTMYCTVRNIPYDLRFIKWWYTVIDILIVSA